MTFRRNSISSKGNLITTTEEYDDETGKLELIGLDNEANTKLFIDSLGKNSFSYSI